MTAATSYRLDEGLKQRLAHQAAAEGVTETALVTRLLDEGLDTMAHPGIVYRPGPTGRRAAVAGGPDVWEILVAVRHVGGRGDSKVVAAAAELGLAEHLVRLAVDFAATRAAEIEARIVDNEAAADRARKLAQERDALLAS